MSKIPIHWPEKDAIKSAIVAGEIRAYRVEATRCEIVPDNCDCGRKTGVNGSTYEKWNTYEIQIAVVFSGRQVLIAFAIKIEQGRAWCLHKQLIVLIILFVEAVAKCRERDSSVYCGKFLGKRLILKDRNRTVAKPSPLCFRDEYRAWGWWKRQSYDHASPFSQLCPSIDQLALLTNRWTPLEIRGAVRVNIFDIRYVISDHENLAWRSKRFVIIIFWSIMASPMIFRVYVYLVSPGCLSSRWVRKVI